MEEIWFVIHRNLRDDALRRKQVNYSVAPAARGIGMDGVSGKGTAGKVEGRLAVRCLGRGGGNAAFDNCLEDSWQVPTV